MAEYLAAKRTVDDRALNERVWRRFVSELGGRRDGAVDGREGAVDGREGAVDGREGVLSDDGREGTGEDFAPTEEPIRVLDVGTGIGTMAARLAERERFDVPVSYRGIDVDPSVIAAGRERLPGWLEAAGYDVTTEADRIVARPQGRGGTTRPRFEISLEVADVASITDEADAVIAAAFLDVVDLETTLAQLRGCLRDGGILYAPCTYDGRTAFVPSDPLDRRIERLYHRHMDEIRDRPGSARAGEQLLEAAPQFGFDVIEAGGGDWVVRPGPDGYDADEGRFLEFLLETIDGALSEYPDSVLSSERREVWVDDRLRQVKAGELALIAHNLDVLARVR